MYLSSLRLSPANINAVGVEENSAHAVAVKPRFLNKESETPESYDILCLGAKGSQYSLRVSYSEVNKTKVDALQKALAKTEVVRIVPDPDTLKISAYAFIGEKGTLVSGVSVKAETFDIADNDDEEDFIV